MPGDHDLSGRDAVLLREAHDQRQLEQVATHAERSPRLREDSVRGVVGAELGLRPARVDLHLDELGGDAGRGDQAIDVLGHEVRDADVSHEPALAHRDESFPCLDVLVLIRIRPVHEQQVEVVETESAHAGFGRLGDARDAVPLLVELRRHEDVLARHPACRQAASYADLVAVGVRGVEPRSSADATATSARESSIGQVPRPIVGMDPYVENAMLMPARIGAAGDGPGPGSALRESPRDRLRSRVVEPRSRGRRPRGHTPPGWSTHAGCG